MRLFNTPLKGCKILATKNHYSLNENDYIGRVKKIDGNIVTFIDRHGEKNSVIWQFSTGKNQTIKFSA